MTPDLSIIIPAYNVVDYLGDAIRSAIAQQGVTFEIVVVDDGSTDGTRAVMDSFANDPRMKLLAQENQGPSGSRNTALQIAKGRYIGFLDADDLWEPIKAAKHVAFMDANPVFDITYSWWRVIDEAGRDTGRRNTVPVSSLPRGASFAGLLIENFTGTASTVFCRRETVVTVGGFDNTLRSNVDLDLLLRIAALRSGNIGLIPELLTSYRMRPGQITKDWPRMMTNWKKLVSRLQQVHPDLVDAAVLDEATARQLRYCAYIAYEAGDYAAARRLVYRAWAHRPQCLARDKRAWLTTAAIAATLLPARIHDQLADAAKAYRARNAQS